MMNDRRLLGIRGVDWLFGLTILLTAVLVAWRWHMPMFTEMQALSSRLVARHAVRQDLDQLRATIERIGSKTKGLEQRLAGYEGDVLAAREGVCLEIVARAQEQCGVDLEQILPGAKVSGGAGAYDYIPVRVVTRGTFSESLCYMHELGTNTWSTQVVSLRIHADPKTSVCQMNLEVRFHLGPQPRRTEQQTAGVDTSMYTGA